MNQQSGDAKLSKSAKRRQNRKAAKAREDGTEVKGASSFSGIPTYQETLTSLQSSLEKAREEKNHAEAKIIRQRIWLLQDSAAGVKSNVSDEQLLSILNATKVMEKSTSAVTIETLPAPALSFSESQKMILEKKLKKIQKKKKEITKLKVRLEKGEKLEPTQTEKINREKDVDKEINETEQELIKISS